MRVKAIIYLCFILFCYFFKPSIIVIAQSSPDPLDTQPVEIHPFEVQPHTAGQVSEIPAEYLPVYLSAGEAYGVKWNVLAAIHKIETGFGTNLSVSSAGALGHMQFMPKTWIGWSYPLPSIPPDVLTNLSIIEKYHGYGVDANGDGIADPWDPEDAVFAAAKYLAANGAADGDYERAVFAYNHAEWYVRLVLETAEQYAGLPVSGDPAYDPLIVSTIIEAATSWLGKSTYVFGGGRTDHDIANGIFDCSSFVHWCYLQAGIQLGDRGYCSTNSLILLGNRISLAEAVPGDLIFFDTYQTDGHVGIYIGYNKAIGCQSAGVGIIDLANPYWESVFHGHIRHLFT